MIGVYSRVSTPDQDLSRQVKSGIEFATSRLGAELNGSGDPRSISMHAEENALSYPADFGPVRVYVDKSTGTNTDRDGFREMMADVDAGELESVVVHSVSRLARSIRDLESIADRIVEQNDTGLFVISESFELESGDDDPYQRAMFQLLGVFAELEAEMTKRRITEGIQTRMDNEDYHHGPAPLGFKKNEGVLVETAQFDQVCAVLDIVDRGEMSQRQAAKRLECGRKTVRRAINEKGELYGLN